MKIKILGCSGAQSPRHRLPSLLLDGKIVFDAGSLTSILDINDLLKLKYIFITHSHLDHIVGIPFLADYLIFSKRRHKAEVISIPPVIAAIRESLLDGSIWPDFTLIPNASEATLALKELEPGRSMKIDAYTITPFRVNHAVPAAGYLVEDSGKRRFFYTGDAGPSDTMWEQIGGKLIHCLIIDVSLPNRLEEFAIKAGHLTPRLLKNEISKIRQLPEKIYITHAKPQFLIMIKKEIEKLKLKNIRLLKDGDLITV